MSRSNEQVLKDIIRDGHCGSVEDCPYCPLEFTCRGYVSIEDARFTNSTVKLAEKTLRWYYDQAFRRDLERALEDTTS